MPPGAFCEPPVLEESAGSPRAESTTPPGSTADGSAPTSTDDEVQTPPPAKKGWKTMPRPVRSVSENAAPGTTTVTLKNVPKKCGRDQLIQQLEDAGFGGGRLGLVYLPVDLGKKCGMGQAVLGFHNIEACEQFTNMFHKASTKTIAPNLVATKPLEVSPAPVQGISANLEKVRSSALLMDFLATMPEWLPRVFDEEGKAAEFTGDAESDTRSRPEH